MDSTLTRADGSMSAAGSKSFAKKIGVAKSKSITAQHILSEDYSLTATRFLPDWVTEKPFFTPAIVPLDLIFFRRIFSSLNKRHGNARNEVPIAVFQRGVVRLFRVLGMSTDFHSEDYDVDGSGAVGWYEFVTCWRRSKVAVNLSFPERVFLCLEDPSSCIVGQFVSTSIMALIFISCSCFIIGTLPEFRAVSDDCPSCEPEQLEAFAVFETVCIALFTVEYVLRVVMAPFARTELLDYDQILQYVTENEDVAIPKCTKRLVRFLVMPMNLIDLAVIAPYYMETLVSVTVANLTVLRVLRLTRLFRLVKLGRYFEILQLILRVFNKSMRALYVLFFYFVLAVSFSGAAMYFVEGGTWDPELQDYVRDNGDGTTDISPFKSIPHSFWWCVVTYTTTGYGDMYPITGTGKFVGAATMLAGIIVLAMPISLISLNFSQVWQEFLEEQRMEAEAQEQDILCVQRALESIDSRTHLLIEVFDDHHGGIDAAEFLGEVTWDNLPVESNVPVSREERRPLKANPKKGKVGRAEGFLHTTYSWTPMEALPETGPDSEADQVEDGEAPRKKIRNGSKGASAGCRSASSIGEDIRGVLEVCVHRAEGLIRSDWKLSGVRDVYAVVHAWPRPSVIAATTLDGLGIASEQYATLVAQATLDPIWEETASFRFEWSKDWTPSRLNVMADSGQATTDTGGKDAASTASFVGQLTRSPTLESKKASADSLATTTALDMLQAALLAQKTPKARRERPCRMRRSFTTDSDARSVSTTDRSVEDILELHGRHLNKLSRMIAEVQRTMKRVEAVQNGERRPDEEPQRDSSPFVRSENRASTSPPKTVSFDAETILQGKLATSRSPTAPSIESLDGECEVASTLAATARVNGFDPPLPGVPGDDLK